MENLLKPIAFGAVRHFATVLAGMLISEGVITGEQTNDLIGSVLFLATVAWSAYDKYAAHKKLVSAKQ